MKEHLPYNLLLILAVAVGGLAVLYNTVLRESYATTLRYEYPAIESPVQQPTASKPGEIPPAADETIIISADALAEPPEEWASAGVRFPLELNEATEEQLKYIPRVGDVMAQRIIQYRQELGGYTDLAQLRDIKGVGDSTYELLWSYLYIAGEDDASAAEGAGE